MEHVDLILRAAQAAGTISWWSTPTVWSLLPTALAIGAMGGATYWLLRRRGKGSVGSGHVAAIHWPTPVPTYRRSIAQLASELARGRRYRRPLVVVVLRLTAVEMSEPHGGTKHGNGNSKSNGHSGPNGNGNGNGNGHAAASANGRANGNGHHPSREDGAGNASHAVQIVFSLVGSILRDSLRESDITTYDVANDRYIILLPESDATQAAQTVKRLTELVYKRTSARIRTGIAEYPADGLIIEDLVQSAAAACRGAETLNRVAIATRLPVEER